MNATLKVNRLALRGKLEDRIKAVEENWKESEETKELEEALDVIRNGEDPKKYAKRLAQWHQHIADGLGDGSLKVTETGRVSGGPDKPKKNFPNRNRWVGWDAQSVARELDRRTNRLKSWTDPLKAAIELLDLSNEEEVVIDAADYHKLLGGNG